MVVFHYYYTDRLKNTAVKAMVIDSGFYSVYEQMKRDAHKNHIPGIMVHWVNNTLAYTVYNIFPNANDIKVVDLFGGDYIRVALSVVFSFLILIPAIYQLHLRMKREA